MANAIKNVNGALFVQPNGPNTALYFLGCADVGDVTIPRAASTPILCSKADRSGGWDLKGRLLTPPGFPTVQVTEMSSAMASYIESMKCSGAMYVLYNCGNKSLFDNNAMSLNLLNARVTQVVKQNPEASISTTAEAILDNQFSLEMDTVLSTFVATIGRKTTAETGALNDLWVNTNQICSGECTAAINPGDLLYAPADAVAAATANVQKSSDAMETWAACAADPFAGGKNAMAITSFMIGASTRRVLVSEEGTAGAVQGHTAYSDDGGATWTTYNLGGATAGHGATKGGGLFSLDMQHIWLAGAAGYIYKSTDGGVSFTAVESGVVSANAYTKVHFADELYGMAVSTAGVVALTSDGGATWYAGTAITATPNLTACFRFDKYRMFVGTATGQLWYSNDAGVTWTRRTGFYGDGTGTIPSIDFLNPYIGFMAKNSASPVGTILRTINGGYSWDPVTTPANVGLNVVRAIDENHAAAVGEVSTTAVILKIYA